MNVLDQGLSESLAFGGIFQGLFVAHTSEASGSKHTRHIKSSDCKRECFCLPSRLYSNSYTLVIEVGHDVLESIVFTTLEKNENR